MRGWLLLVLAGSVLMTRAAPVNEEDWRSSLALRLPDLESATGIHLLRSGPAETVAAKFERLQASVLAVSGGKNRLPVFISPALGRELVPAQDEERLGAPVMNISVAEAIKFVCARFKLQYEVTDAGVIVSRP